MRVRARFLRTLLPVTLVVFGLLSVLGARTLSSAVEDSARARLSRELALISPLLPTEPAALKPLLDNFAERLHLRITVIAADGRVIEDSSYPSAEVLENHGERPEILAAGETGSGEAVRTSASTGRSYYYSALRIEHPTVRYLRLALPSEELRSFSSTYMLYIGAGLAAALAALGVAGSLAVSRLARPLELMANDVELVASGELTRSVPVPTDEELQRLAGSVNRMRDALVDRIHATHAERELLSAVTEGLEEGLMLVDHGHRVVVANRAMRELFAAEGLEVGEKVEDFARHNAILEAVNACLASEEDRRDLIDGPSGTNRSFDLHATSVTLPDGTRGALVLLFDVTRMEALEQVRRRFIADVSHELRTPVTSIKGAVETLIDTETLTEPGRRFLEIARRQSDRMADLVADLTDLSRIETGAISLSPESVDLLDLVGHVVEAVRSRYQSRRVTVDLKIPRGFLVWADRRRLEQILVNLTDNAVKYTPDQGKVEIAGCIRDGSAVIRVSDTGPGIPQSSIEKVFNRFYRVDRARSRELGGTGLGLAIVKHLMKLHRGRVWVESEVGVGSQFFIELPPPPPAGRERGS